MAYSRVYAGDRLPAAVNDIDLLILLGGAQSPATPRSECPHFDAEAEQALVSRAISANRAVRPVEPPPVTRLPRKAAFIPEPLAASRLPVH
jgi:hypothetical protein